MKIGVLCSGALGFRVLKEIYINRGVELVFTDKKSKEVIGYSEQEDIPLFVGNPRHGRGYQFICKYEIDVLISINYLFLVEKDIFSYAKRLSFNIHGSLLPKYRGRTPHVWAIINNEKETGITAHKIEDGCDTGDVILQYKIGIDNADTGNDLLNKFHVVYGKMVFEVLKGIENESITLIPQDNSKATYFGKRTPDDGKICWGWQKERIYNWVRAQAYPYPGAYCYYKDNKITIDKIEYTDVGFNQEIPNGRIIDNAPVLIKTPNGAIKIIECREKITFDAGEILK